MEREIVATDRAPAAVGPYSQAVKVGDLVFTAGQVALDPATGQLVEGGVEAQTRQVMHNIAAVLEAAGTSLDNVVKTTIFVTDMSDLQAVNAVYGGFFSGPPPARSTIGVAALPLGARLEIETVALIPAG